MAVECDYSCEYHCTENWTIPKKCEVIMSNKKWHENISKHGVLCKTTTDNKQFVLIEDKQDFLEFLSDYAVDETELTPVTPQEWWQFAPWQPIETAPRDGEIFIAKSKNGRVGECVDCGNGFKGVFFDDENQLMEWLPLPQLD